MLNLKTQCLSIYSWTISPWNSSFCRKIVSFTNFVTSNCVHNHFKQSRLKIREEQYPGTFHNFYMSESVVHYYNAHVLGLNLIKKTISSTHHCCDFMACFKCFFPDYPWIFFEKIVLFVFSDILIIRTLFNCWALMYWKPGSQQSHQTILYWIYSLPQLI